MYKRLRKSYFASLVVESGRRVVVQGDPAWNCDHRCRSLVGHGNFRKKYIRKLRIWRLIKPVHVPYPLENSWEPQGTCILFPVMLVRGPRTCQDPCLPRGWGRSPGDRWVPQEPPCESFSNTGFSEGKPVSFTFWAGVGVRAFRRTNKI